MRFTYIRIRNFKSIRDMELSEIDSALILVGKNNTGKTSVLDAVRLMTGGRKVQESDFLESGQNIEIETRLQIEKEDLRLFHELAVVSAYRRYEVWERIFQKPPPFRTSLYLYGEPGREDAFFRRGEKAQPLYRGGAPQTALH